MLFSTKRLGGVVYTIAETEKDKLSVYKLLHTVFVGAGHIQPDASGVTIMPHHHLVSTKIFIAKRGDHILATFGFFPDAQLGLPTLDRHFRAEIDQFRQQGLRIAEIGALATSGHLGREKISLIMHLNRVMFRHAIAQGFDLLVIKLHPRHLSYYHDILLFEQFGNVAQNTRADGSPSVALKLDLRTVFDRYRDKYTNVRKERNLYNFMTQSCELTETEEVDSA